MIVRGGAPSSLPLITAAGPAELTSSSLRCCAIVVHIELSSMAVVEAEPRRTLYPAFEPYDKGFLKVSDVHTLYYEQSGNPSGKPAVVLHGGPGTRFRAVDFGD